MPPVSGFVRRDGARLTLDGQPFPIAGANNYYLGYLSDDVTLGVLDLAAAMRMNVLRIWGFYDTAELAPVSFHYRDPNVNWPVANNGPDGLDRFDRAVALAVQRGIRLIVPLVNYWSDFGGMAMYAQWFQLAGRDDFYRDGRCRAAYWQWAEHMITRTNPYTGRAYLDEPAILAWELANEPECPRSGGVDEMLSWIWEMSSLIKGKDPNHLIAIGDQGYFQRPRAGMNHLFNGSHGVSCEEFLGGGSVDFGTFHLYESMAGSDNLEVFGEMWIREHVEAGLRASKPMLLEEFGATLDRPDVVTSTGRARLYERWLQVARDSGAMGALAWMIGLPSGPSQPFGWDPYVIATGPESDTLLAHAMQLGL